jgi:hypothetical protein
MNRTKATNIALDIIKLRIQSGILNADSATIVSELETLIDGLEKVNEGSQQGQAHSTATAPHGGPDSWMS